MLVCFFESVGIVHKECVSAGQAANQYYYTEILERLRKRVMRVRRNIAQNWIHRHDNAPGQAALSVAHYLISKCITVMPQPPHSPDLAPCYFFLFQKVKSGSGKTPFWVNRRHPKGLKRHPTSCIPGMLQNMAGPLEKVCAGATGVLWRWPHCSWWINKIKLFFWTSLITLLSDLVDGETILKRVFMKWVKDTNWFLSGSG